ncbi:PREDICTED: putative phosphoenolpyruvate synthase [Priapulus caudatus]|uniref:Phosphoenolpyruvate synthase n=1 Tax=Priapulus caudatus TaxID=37621 RepID=A0ABM1E1F3_PRICU|nr:PREDICTED: putative phosphoenolpyruvate synthase [Priapulus caudatus]
MYIGGLDRHGNWLVARITRLPGRTAEVWLMLKLADGQYYHFPSFPDTRVYNCDGESFTAGGLQIELLKPLMKWRVTFNGLLREGERSEWNADDEGKLVHVKFAFTWTALTGEFSYENYYDPWTVSDAVAREPWSRKLKDNLMNLSKKNKRYEVCGQLYGKLTVEGEAERTLLLRGVREHSFGIRDWKTYNRYISNWGHLKDGTLYSISAKSMYGVLSHIVSGYIVLPSGQRCVLKSTDLHLSRLGEFTQPPDKFDFNVLAGHFECTITTEKKLEQILYVGERWSAKIHEQLTDVTINGVNGWGVTEYMYRYRESCPVPIQKSASLPVEPEIKNPDALVLPFSNITCTASQIVGGKGAQLALLTQLPSKFQVPNGFCITVAAYRHHLNSNKQLKDLIQELQDVSSERKPGDLHEISKLLVENFTKTKLSQHLVTTILEQLTQMFGDMWEKKAYAVRSSAIGEDGKESSYAGQMKTFLGVKESNKIFEAILKCWASSFAYQVVEYRRNHGQVIAADVGVCIQEMLNADVAGVLFTRDPVSGNPGVMTINASYGIGEAVVSGATEPDTIYLQRSFSNKLSIKETVVGSKAMKMIVDSELGGLMQVEMENNGECCLPGKVALDLGCIGIQVEQLFSSEPQDIEFALEDGQIYLLQSRPITSLNIESDFELTHEYDGPLIIDEEMFTIANVGEVIPGCSSPLSNDIMMSGFATSLQHWRTTVAAFAHRSNVEMMITSFCRHVFINMLGGMYYINEYTMGKDTRQAKDEMDLGLFMRSLGDEVLDEIHKRYRTTRTSWYQKIRGQLFCIYDALVVQRHVASMEALAENIKTDMSITDPLTFYNEVTKDLAASVNAWHHHMHVTYTSLFTSGLLQAILSGQGSSKDVMSDLAMLLSNCTDVVSADVPAAVKKIALAVIDSGKAEFFRELTPEQAVDWLRSSESGDLNQLFNQFIETHGHRGMREIDLSAIPWRIDPVQVVKSIQFMTKSPDQLKDTKSYMNNDEIIHRIKTPVGFIRKKILQFLVPIAKKSVRMREMAKSNSIKCSDYLRQVLTRLGELLVQEGYLPDKELIYYFTFGEIERLIISRSAKLVIRATRRRKLTPALTKLQFPEILSGYPMPIEDDCSIDVSNTQQVTGMPVSHGTVRAKCRVAMTLGEAETIQPGEVLITRSTDIGWSHVFPMISGLCTEMGGIISHGAVVAREYGLPCIVSARNATSIFKTGDEVILNGAVGTMAKVV